MKNRWKTDVLEILEVLIFAFLVAFGRRHFSYMCAVRGVQNNHSSDNYRQEQPVSSCARLWSNTLQDPLTQHIAPSLLLESAALEAEQSCSTLSHTEFRVLVTSAFSACHASPILRVKSNREEREARNGIR